MNRNKKNRPAAAVADGLEAPYTRADHGNGGPLTGAGAAELRAHDRKLTDGLNLLHGQVQALRDDLREDRKEMRDGLKEGRTERTAIRDEAGKARTAFRDEASKERTEIRDEAKTERQAIRLEAKTDREAIRLEAKTERQAIRLEAKAERAAMRDEVKAGFAEVRTMLEALAASQQELAAQTAVALERSSSLAWTRRRIVVSVAAGILLLLAGALAKPLFSQLAAALLPG